MLSIQTNYASMVAQNNLNTNNNFQTQTISALTSGYRINNSGDDPAGLAVANQYRDSVAELNQGIQNANDGVSTLQIIDGGLNNISTMLDRLQTLATESASSTFSGNRANINVEYQQLVTDITRQASNIGLNSGGNYNVVNNVFIGGGNNTANSQVVVDLSGTNNQVDAAGLGIANTSVVGGGTELTGNSKRLDAPGATFLSASATQAFTFNLVNNNSATSITATVTGTAGGLSQSQVLSSLNSQLQQYGITAQVGSDGQLAFSGSTAFTASTTTADATDQIATTLSTATNSAVYTAAGAATYGALAENLTFQNGQGTASVALTAGESLSQAISDINAKTSSLGIYAVKNSAGTGISFQSIGNFSASTNTAASTFTAAGAATVAAPTSSATETGNAVSAVTSIQNALQALGQIQARVGAGENKLQYAIDLANSQVTNLSSAESQLRDADVAKEAANLSKAQVLQQASIAAMAQANQAPQSVLKLLQG